jgi:adenylate cyclase class 2
MIDFPLEIEVKYAVSDPEQVKRQLLALGAILDKSREDVDHYFNAPDRDFGRTDEALRVRQIGQHNYVTYKGPKIDSQTKTRKEIEVALEPGKVTADEFRQLLTHLGYRPVATVRKQRGICRLQRGAFNVEIYLDEVEDLGRFIELEIMATPNDLERARTTLLQIGQELGLGHSERRSYLELLLAKRS